MWENEYGIGIIYVRVRNWLSMMHYFALLFLNELSECLDGTEEEVQWGKNREAFSSEVIILAFTLSSIFSWVTGVFKVSQNVSQYDVSVSSTHTRKNILFNVIFRSCAEDTTYHRNVIIGDISWFLKNSFNSASLISFLQLLVYKMVRRKRKRDAIYSDSALSTTAVWDLSLTFAPSDRNPLRCARSKNKFLLSKNCNCNFPGFF